MENTPAGGSSTNGHSSPIRTSEKPNRRATVVLGVCSRDQEREAGLADATGTRPGATLEQASSGLRRAGTLPSPNPG